MNSEIDTTVEQGVFELFCEHTLATDHRKRIVLNVTRCLDDLDVNVELRIQTLQTRARLFSLPQSEFRTARTYDQRARHRRSLLERIFRKIGRVRLARLIKTTHLADDRM